MKRQLNFLTGFGLGAALSYLFAPGRRRRRRMLLRDKMIHLSRVLPNKMSVAGRDLAHRSHGTFAGFRSAFRKRDGADFVIESRIRSKMGRVVSHPHSIQVASEGGKITLRGLILAHEHDAFVDAVSRVRGVRKIDNRLEVHKQDENIPSLQGGVPRTGERIDILQSNWSPATRLLMGATGGAAAGYGFYRRDPVGAVLGAVGLLSLARALTNIETKRLLGVGGGRRAVQLQKTIHINAPIEHVYRVWSNFADFPKFMSDVKHVRVTNERQSHWLIRGPLGARMSFDAELTASVPNKILAWRSAPGELIQHAGQAKFFPSEHGGTKIELRFSYNPPAGVLGHDFARIFGSDPKKRFESALNQLKQVIERGPSRRQARAFARAG